MDGKNVDSPAVRQRIPACRKKKTARYAWAEDASTDDLWRIPASRESAANRSTAEYTKVVDLRRRKVRCAWAGHDSSDEDHQGTPAYHSGKVRKIPASRKKAGRRAWAEGGNTDAQAADAMTEVETLSATINTAKVCAVALRPSSASPSRPAATRMNAWDGALSSWTDEAAEAAPHAERSLGNPPSSSTAWACHQSPISDAGEKPKKPLSEGSVEQEPLVLIDLENDQADTWGYYELFQELTEALEASTKKLNDKRKIYSELAQRAAVSGVAGPATAFPAAAPTAEADAPCVRTRVMKNKEYESHVVEYPAMSDFSDLEDTDDSDQEAICRELVEILEDCAREEDEKIEHLSRLLSCAKTETQMFSIAVGPDGSGEPPAAKAAAPWLEESSSKLLKNKTLPPLIQPPKAQQGRVKKTRKKTDGLQND
ncbi:hypothetical protein AOLI_G00001570 [Acnodon oligacanthus]